MDSASRIYIYEIPAFNLYEMSCKYGGIRSDSNFQLEIINLIAESNNLSVSSIDCQESVRKFMNKVKSFCCRIARAKAKRSGYLWIDYLAQLRMEIIHIPITFNDINAHLSAKIEILEKEKKKLSNKLLDFYVFQQENAQLRLEVNSLKMKYRQFQFKPKRGLSTLHRLGFKQYTEAQLRKQRKRVTDQLRTLLADFNFRGLKPQSINLKQPGSGKTIEINLNPSVQEEKKRQNADRDRINMVLLLKDQMLISDNSYNELAQIFTDSSRPSALLQRKKELSGAAGVKFTDGPIQGAYLSFSKQLGKRIRLLQISDSRALENRMVNVRLSLDSTRIGEKPALVMGFQILKDSLASNSLRPLTIALCGESYGEIRTVFATTIAETEETTSIMVNGINYEIVYHLTGDLKMINCLTGLQACNACFSCPWCKSSKADRMKCCFDVTQKKRTIEENLELAAMSCRNGKNSTKFGVIRAPIFKFIPLTRTVPDCLHAFLRISDCIFDQTLQIIREKDNLLESSGTRSNLLGDLKSEIRSLGVFFDIRVQDGKLSWTSLPRLQRITVFKKLNLAKYSVEI